MTDDHTLIPASELARKNTAHFPNESGEYRKARNDLLAEEIELRRHIWRVGEIRRSLPPGGEVTKDYRFEGSGGEIGLEDLFGEHDTLIVYSMMYGLQREQGCPMCTAQLDSWDGAAPHIEKRTALAVVARSPYQRTAAYGRERGWRNLKLYSDPGGDFTEDFVGERDADMPAYTVFCRKDGTIRHFYSSEGSFEMADPGQDPHNAPDMNPLWILLDTTPEGRGTDWYPKLDD
jgi:predicted dithiol-disulfide oxidoreductase (DUF899 family)